MKTQTRNLVFRLLLALGLVVTLAATSVSTARAIEVDQTGSVGEGRVVDDDLVLAGDSVVMAGTVNGTLIAAGANVTISGTVNGDVYAAGANISVTGTVQGNLVAVGGHVSVSATVGNSLAFAGSSLTLGSGAKVEGNLYAAGASITLESGSTVGQDAAVAGYQLILRGSVGRDVQAALEAFELDGSVGRDVLVRVGDDSEGSEVTGRIPFQDGIQFLSPGLNISSGASIGGRLEYYCSVEQKSGIRIEPPGGVQYHYQPRWDRDEWRGHTVSWPFNISALFVWNLLGFIREFLTLLLLGALAMWLIPAFLPRAVETLRAKPFPSLGWGFLLLICGIVALILCAVAVLLLGLAVGVVTLFGLMSVVFGLGFSAIGLSGTVFVVLAQYGSKLVIALLIGDWIVRLVRKDYSGNPFWPLLLGVFLVAVFDAVPVFGWLFALIAIFFGFGAICIALYEWWKRRKTAA